MRTLVFAATIILSACGNKEASTKTENSLAENPRQEILFERLIGVWKSENGKSYERWTKNADGSYFSLGFMLNGTDTIITESVYIHSEDGQWVSENSVPEQNEGKAIQFKVTTLTADEAHFSNPAHDFPTDIHYHLQDERRLMAYIAGPGQGVSQDTIRFSFERMEE